MAAKPAVPSRANSSACNLLKQCTSFDPLILPLNVIDISIVARVRNEIKRT
jgi:hypothetical protein